MIEITVATIIITVIIVLTLRNTKRVALENPLILNRTGQYHAILAPKLNVAQTFVETVAKQLSDMREANQDSATQCFEVRDPEAAKLGQDLYLLAITMRDGLLYFQAVTPDQPNGNPDMHRHKLLEAAHNALARIPVAGTHNDGMDEHVIASASRAAHQLGIQLKKID